MRIIKVWVEAKLTLVEMNMVTIPQVFFALRHHARRQDACGEGDERSPYCY
jgi:hypothetical protein